MNDNNTKPPPKPEQPKAPPKPKPDTPQQRKDKLEAHVRLERLDAGVGLPEPVQGTEYDGSYHDELEAAYLAVDKEKYAEIKKNRETLGLSTAPEQMPMPDPAIREKEQKKTVPPQSPRPLFAKPENKNP